MRLAVETGNFNDYTADGVIGRDRLFFGKRTVAKQPKPLRGDLMTDKPRTNFSLPFETGPPFLRRMVCNRWSML